MHITTMQVYNFLTVHEISSEISISRKIESLAKDRKKHSYEGHVQPRGSTKMYFQLHCI